VVSFTPWSLYSQGKSPWYPLDRRLGGPQSWSELSGKEKYSQSQKVQVEFYKVSQKCTKN